MSNQAHSYDLLEGNRSSFQKGSVPFLGVVFSHSQADAVLVSLSLLHCAALLAFPTVLLIALGFWWNSNTISHNFIHLPFFRSRGLNQAFSFFQSLLLGMPQRLWKDRHMAHHAEREWKWKWSQQLVIEGTGVICLWAGLIWWNPQFAWFVYFPGLIAGLLICKLHGYYEHVRGTVSHYGKPYNFLFFNDGFHVEHHRGPAQHWTSLPRLRGLSPPESRWPACLRWLERFNLDALEKGVLRSSLLQHFVLSRHEQAFRKLLPESSRIQSVVIVGGGIFPRTAMILQKLIPQAKISVIEKRRDHIEIAKAFVTGVEFVEETYPLPAPVTADLMIVPLAFLGSTESIFAGFDGRTIIKHDWLWNSRGVSSVISLWLLKRLNRIDR